jgi:hypothetical protein
MKVGKKKTRILPYFWLLSRTSHKNLAILIFSSKSGEFGTFIFFSIKNPLYS